MAPHKPILAAFDPESMAREAVEFGIAATRITGAPLTVVAVRSGGPLVNRLAGEVDDSVGGDARTLEHLRLELQRREVDGEVRVFDDNTAARGLDRAMRELEPELVVVGSTKRSAAGSVLMGTTAERILHASPCPVAVVPKGYERPEEGVRTIGVAFSPTPEGREALHAAAALARGGRARLRAITVVEPKDAEEESSGLLARAHHEADAAEDVRSRKRVDAEAVLREAVAEEAGELEVEIDVLAQDPADGLVAVTRHVDMLVMGSRAYGPKRAVMLGSVSRRVMERATCPVLIIPRGTTEATEALIGDAETQRPG
jgi:nucleotide-binding universal stress UspA family protein